MAKQQFAGGQQLEKERDAISQAEEEIGWKNLSYSERQLRTRELLTIAQRIKLERKAKESTTS
jgi:hypothetical protein